MEDQKPQQQSGPEKEYSLNESKPEKSPHQPAHQPQSDKPAQPGTSPVSSIIKDLNLDKRAVETIKWSAIMYAVANGLRIIISTYGFYFGGGYFGGWGTFMDYFPTSLLINKLIYGVIVGAIAGFVLSKFYNYIQVWNVKYLKSKLNTFFKLLFYPSVAGYIVPVLISMLSAFYGFGLGFLILIIGDVFVCYLYAKVVTSKVGSMYPSPIATPETKK